MLLADVECGAISFGMRLSFGLVRSDDQGLSYALPLECQARFFPSNHG
jgi:hypothetical protein